jgi:outer membrane immunogenic protein
MKRFLLAAVAGFIATALASPSLAADIPRKAPVYKAPVYVAGFSWTGFYIGANGGGGWGKSEWSDPIFGGGTGNFKIKGFLAGGTVGYNQQTGVWVWGVEGDLDASWINGAVANANCPLGCETKNPWLATARGRVGYAAMERWMPYVTGGAAFGRINMNPATFAPDGKTKAGWTVGGGVEYAFLGPWSAKVEYLYADLGKATCSAAACGGPLDVTFKANIVRAGINYRF